MRAIGEVHRKVNLCFRIAVIFDFRKGVFDDFHMMVISWDEFHYHGMVTCDFELMNPLSLRHRSEEIAQGNK